VRIECALIIIPFCRYKWNAIMHLVMLDWWLQLYTLNGYDSSIVVILLPNMLPLNEILLCGAVYIHSFASLAQLLHFVA
jgi:hypothetical protein